MIPASLLMTAFTCSLAQTNETRGAEPLTEGRRYVVAFPQVWAERTEYPMPLPLSLLISSRSKTKVRISTLADPSRNSNPGVDKEVTLMPNVVVTIPVPFGYLHEESEIRKGHGILVTSDEPISVSTYIAWQGNGEMARHLPVEGWGRQYFAMSFYQDRYGSSSAGYKYRPGQILIIADSDSTVVTYTPTVTTEGGPDAPSTPKGASTTITLGRGQTFLIKARIDSNGTRDWSTDLSGTFIESSRPIGVISGHTKGAITRYPDALPPTGAFASEAHFVRSNVHDAMLPIEMAGTEFVTIPGRYTPARVVGRYPRESGIDDDRGDLIRVLAIVDGTIVQSMKPDGSFTELRTLRRGESYIDSSVAEARYWKTSWPVLVGQYGKSYAKVLPPLIGRSSDEKVDRAQGHPTVESGMPMLQVVPSIDRWVNYGTFHAPEGMDNFMNIVCRADEVGRIMFDGRALSSAFSPILLPGTPYAYVRTNVGTGDHTIESGAPSVRWAAWNYGSLDGLQQGRAYGTPVAIDLNVACDDSLSIDDEVGCDGAVDVEGRIQPENTTCGAIRSIETVTATNYRLEVDEAFKSGDRNVRYRMLVIDATKNASITVRVWTSSGKYVRKTYSYIAERLVSDTRAINFGTLPDNTPSCKSILFRNMDTTSSVHVTEIKARYYPGTYTFNPANFVLGPGERRKVDVCAAVASPELKLDVMSVVFDCSDTLFLSLTVKGTVPPDTATSVEQDRRPVFTIGTPSPQPVSIHGVVSIPIESIEQGEMVLTFYDETGRMVGSTMRIAAEGGKRNVRLDLPKLAPSPGLHILRIQMPSGAVRTIPLMLTE